VKTTPYFRTKILLMAGATLMVSQLFSQPASSYEIAETEPVNAPPIE
jgi:hypothetical protein